MIKSLACLLLFAIGVSAAPVLVAPSDTGIVYIGRWDHTDPKAAVGDWPGIYFKAAFQGTGVEARLDGRNVFEAWIDGQKEATLAVSDSAQWFQVAQGLSNDRHVLTLYKRSESQTNATRFLGLRLAEGATMLKAPSRSPRRVEFIGDSYTVGYGMEAPGHEPAGLDEDSLVLFSTNAVQAFGPLVARGFGAEYQLNAFSGRGLVRNLNGMEPQKPYGYFYESTLMSQKNTKGTSPIYDFNSWHPQVVVIGLGINDFQGNAPYADTAKFDAAYHALLTQIRIKHPGVKFILCSTKVWPTEALVPRVQAIAAAEEAKGNHDVTVFTYGSENTGLYFHPSAHDHENIARELRPVLARVAGWLSR